ncbi:MAG: AMP-binding protein [Acetobacteraceae bacterium]|nr:AMP-binding protein [Acetobacteraceae bacterium]
MGAERLLGRALRAEVVPEGLATLYEHFRCIQAEEAWATLGSWVEAVRPQFGPGVAERFAAARQMDPAKAAAGRGFLRTGDVGVMDEDGYVTLVDRIKDLILCSGFNVYPRVVEEALYRHPDVVAATVVGMPDDYRGESPAAFVQARPGSGLTEAALREFLKDKLSPVEMPRLIELRDALPRTPVGKLSKKELRAELLERFRPGPDVQ